MTTLFSLLLLGICLVFVAWPLFRAGTDEVENAEDPTVALELQKLEAYAAIREAEFDLNMGKLTESDFTALKEKHSRQALAAMAAMEQARAVAPGKRQGASGVTKAKVSFCPDCGARATEGAKFCGSCGRALAALPA